MDKTVLNQRFQYHEITPYRDFCKITENPKKKKKEDDQDSADIWESRWGELQPRMAYVHLEVKNQRTRKNTKYFYSSQPDGERLSLYPYRPHNEQFYTTKDSTLIRHYGRPFSQVSTCIHERTIKVDDDVLSVRINNYSKSRHINCKYFKKHSHSRGFSFNLKTGNIVIYEGAKGSMKIRQNSFEFLLNVMAGVFKRHNYCIGSNLQTKKNTEHPINIEYNKIFDDEEFKKTLYHAISSKLPENSLTKLKYGGEEDAKGLEFAYHGLIEIFVTLKGIKVPNDFIHLMRGWYPTKQYLKKNDNKLIASILDRLGLKTKSLIKLLHKNPRFELAKLTLLGKYFGYNNIHKYIHNISPKFFSDWSTRSDNGYMGVDNMYSLLNNKFEYDIKDSERTSLLKLINSFFDTVDLVETLVTPTQHPDLYPIPTHSAIRNQFGQITDHLDLIVKIRQHLPDMEMRCQSIRDFHTEHLEFSKIDRSIKKGYSIEYKFDPRLIEHVEEPIYPKINLGSEDAPVYTTDMDGTPVYYPVILKIDAEYTEEGKHMHHCVGSYADKEMSVIVSLREGSVDGAERVTCEFDPRDKSCVQAKYFCNAIPPERFEFAIEKIKHRMKIYRGSIKSLSKEKIPLIINGVQLKISNPHDDFLEMLNMHQPNF